MVPMELLLALAAGILWLHRRSVLSPRAHGFYRLFAFESILILLFVQARHWLRDPLSARQLLSWFLLAVSALLAAHGFALLRSLGEPQHGVESTTVLVMRGAYRYIRHPLYSSLMLLAWGALLKHPTILAWGLTLGATSFLAATGWSEERENLDKFGPAYAEYMRVTRMFIPRVL